MKPVVLFYCQHAVGMGHLVRSLALAAALAERFRVVLLSGGRVPRRMPLPPGIELVALPPLALDAQNKLVSVDRRRNVARVQEERKTRILGAYEALRPSAVVIELFPFGRKKFAPELLPLLERTRQQGQQRPLVACSLRDILVSRPTDQQRHDDRAVTLANTYFDVVLVHADPRVVRLEDTFHPSIAIEMPVEYTGLVLGQSPPSEDHLRQRQVIVSAGGGLVGEPLFRAALAAQKLLWEDARVRMHLVAGPFLPEPVWHDLRRQAAGRPGLRVQRFVPDLRHHLATAAASVSQCGYNTALDLLSTGVPALVVPYTTGSEDEQLCRARRLEHLGALRVLESEALSGHVLAREIRALLSFTPAPLHLSLDGAERTASVIADLVSQRQAA